MSCVRLFCDSVVCSLPGFSVYQISQARILEWVAISSKRGSSLPRNQTYISCICRQILYCWATREVYVHVKSLQSYQLFATLWTVAHQVPLSMGFSTHEYWSELSCPPQGNLPNPGIEPMSPALAGRFFTTSAAWETQIKCNEILFWYIKKFNCLLLYSIHSMRDPKLREALRYSDIPVQSLSTLVLIRMT